MDTKICTTIEQSKKLLELGIDVNTADMYWEHRVAGTMVIYEPRVITLMPHANENIPCWSLAALLCILPDKICLNSETYCLNCKKDKVEYLGPMTCDGQKSLSVEADNLVDACYEMILKLNKLKIL